MKRLLISSLFACMLMSQVQAGSNFVITKSDVIGFAKGAALPITCALIKGTAVAINNERSLGKYNREWFKSRSDELKIKKLVMVKRILQESFLPIPKSPLWGYDNPQQRFNFQRYANLFAGLISGGAIAAGLLFGTKDMPHSIGKLIGSQIFANGLVAGGLVALYGSFKGLVNNKLGNSRK